MSGITRAIAAAGVALIAALACFTAQASAHPVSGITARRAAAAVPDPDGTGFSATSFAMAGLIAVLVVLVVGGALMLLAGRMRKPSS